MTSPRTDPAGAPASTAPGRRRFVSIDVFRGLTVGGMILVSNLGNQAVASAQLRHAIWHGVTLRDLIAPFFLFAMGAALAFAFARHVANGPTPALYRTIARRTVVLFVAGLVLNYVLYEFPGTDLADLRVMGVLQRIALVYLALAVLALHVPARVQWGLGVAILLGYWAALTLVPVPGAGAGVLTPEGNLAGYVDRVVIGEDNLHRGGPTDPEGLLGTLPAIVSGLMGYWAGQWLRSRRIRMRTAAPLVAVGLAALAVGFAWDQVFPINKALWTSSYVLVSGGAGLIVLAGFYVLIEVAGGRPLPVRLARDFLEVMGRNSLFAFTVPRAVARVASIPTVETAAGAVTLFAWPYVRLVEPAIAPWAGEANASLAYGLLLLGVWWLVMLGMHRRGWYWRT